MSFRSLLDSRCTIMALTPGAADGMGGFRVATWGILYTRVKCRFESLQKKEMIMAYDKKEVYPDYFIYLVFRSGIKAGQRIYFNSREFEIKLIENWSEQRKYLQLSVTEIKRTK